MGYKRSIFLINRKFQIRFSVYVCSWLLAVSFVYPWIVKNLFDYFIRYLARDPSGPPPEILVQTQREVLATLLSFQVLLLMSTFLISIFMSHRVAGPLYKLRMFINRAKEGDLSEDLYFRKNDHFSEIAEDYNGMIHEMKSHLKRNSEALDQAAHRVGLLTENAQPKDKAELASLSDLIDAARVQNQKLKL